MEGLTLTGLLKSSADVYPERRAVSVSGKFDLTHSRLHQLIDRAAARLAAAGINPGDVVALTFPNTVEMVIMFLGVIRARATAAPLNAAYTEEEFEFYLSDSESKLLITPKEGNNSAQAAASKLNIPNVVAILSDVNADEVELSITTQSQPDVSKLGSNEPSDVALFLHTSGTTSRPKGVPLTQLNLASTVKNIIAVYKLTEFDSTVIVLPLFHVHGLLTGLLSSLGAGAAVTLPSAGRFSASTFWSDMNNYKATWYTAVPTIHQIILERHLSKPEPVYPKLRFVRSCSASLAPAIMTQLEEVFGAPVLEAYAMTEAAHLMCTNPLPENGPHKAGSVGKPVGQEMAILDESGVVQEANVNGEVCIRGPNVTNGYKNNPEANKTAFQFGWFHTGDVGFLDADGYLHLVGRIKELINRGGEKISPIEVDSVLLSHPELAEAVSFGVPDDKYGEEAFLQSVKLKLDHLNFSQLSRLCFYFYVVGLPPRLLQDFLLAWTIFINCAVIPREGSNIDEADVLRHCKAHLASFKVPKKVFMADNLPKTASGKIKRRDVAEHFLSQISTAQVPKFGA
ncbi:hypothetical protein ACFE04_027618 [Oxalis oulophora]